MYKIFSAIIAISLLASCAQEAETKAQDATSDTLQYSYQTLEKEIGDCQKTCLRMYLQSVKVEADTQFQSFLDSLMLSVGSTKYASVDEWIESSTSEFSRILEEIPSYDMPWEMERYVNINFNSLGLLSLNISDYSFTGGAHPNIFVLKRVIDLNTKKILDWKHFIAAEKEEAFLQFAERRLRMENDIKEGESWEDAGFWFENNTFFLPEEFGIDPVGMHFIYNVYEVAPYSSGSISISFSWNDVQPYLAKPFGDLFLSSSL